uniref:Uncharacterized protein n=1 Tax=Anguilla anguilla TaxID=7936 RepID=A0A0E9SC36_ANGAN
MKWRGRSPGGRPTASTKPKRFRNLQMKRLRLLRS